MEHSEHRESGEHVEHVESGAGQGGRDPEEGLVAEGPPHDEPVSAEAGVEAGAAKEPAESEPAGTSPADKEPAVSTSKSPAHAALEELSKEELIDRHVRLVADLRRIRQRARQDEEDARREERDRVIGSFFDVLDAFERGLESAPEEQKDNPWAEGLRAIHRQMLDVLAGFDVKPYSPVGEPFDALVHEALSTMPDPNRPDGTIAFVERTGYRERDRVLRPARVVVVKNA